MITICDKKVDYMKITTNESQFKVKNVEKIKGLLSFFNKEKIEDNNEENFYRKASFTCGKKIVEGFEVIAKNNEVDMAIDFIKRNKKGEEETVLSFTVINSNKYRDNITMREFKLEEKDFEKIKKIIRK